MEVYEYILEAQDFLVKHWGDDGKKVIVACMHAIPYNETFKVFLEECTCCGGNWNGMLLNGIKKLWPEVYDVIPNNLGHFGWNALLYTLLLCGVDTYSE